MSTRMMVALLGLGTILIIAIIVTALILTHLSDVAAFWAAFHGWVYAGVALAVVFLLYRLYRRIEHTDTLRKLERQKQAAVVQEQLALAEATKQKPELERLRLEQEHEYKMAQLEHQWNNFTMPAGHTLASREQDGSFRVVQGSLAPARGIAAPAAAETKEGIGLTLVPPQNFPEPYDLLQIFQQYDITPDHIFLGKSDYSETLWVNSTTQLCHGIFNAVTGRGKTVLERGIETQLLYVGHDVLHMDIKFSVIDDAGLDYRPIAKHILSKPPIEVEPGRFVPRLAVEVEDIVSLLRWLAKVEIPRRLELFRNGKSHAYKTLYAFVEELLYLSNKKPEIVGYINDIVVVGRSLGIKLFTAAQNFQSQSTGISGGISENFETACYLGGDDYSGAKMLDVKLKELTTYLQTYQVKLGGGVMLLRNNTVARPPRLTRGGMSSNDAVYYLLGRADNFKLDQYLSPTPPRTDPYHSFPASGSTLILPRRTGPITDPSAYAIPTQTLPQDTTVEGEGFTMRDTGEEEVQPEKPAAPAYTTEEMNSIIQTAFRLSQENREFTRTDIMETLGWTRKQWPKIKAVCDDFRIALPPGKSDE